MTDRVVVPVVRLAFVKLAGGLVAHVLGSDTEGCLAYHVLSVN